MRFLNTTLAALAGFGLTIGVALAEQANQSTEQSHGSQALKQGQQQQGQQPGQQPGQDAAVRGQQGTDAHQGMAAKKSGLKLKKADSIIGREVVNPQGENLGHIRELAIDGNTGKVAYAVLEYDRITTLRDKLFAVPFKALKVKGGEHAATPGQDQAARDRMEAGKTDDTWFTTDEKDANRQFVLNVTRDKLDSAPGFNRDKWPDMSNAQWASEIHAFYGEKQDTDAERRHGVQGGQTARTDRDVDVDVDVNREGARADVDRNREGLAQGQSQRMILKADEQLMGEDIVNNNGEDIGELNNLLIDRNSGKVALVVVKLDNVEGDKNMAALPWNQIKWNWNEQEKEGSIVLRADVNQVKGQLFAENSWPHLDRQYVTNIYRQFNARPFWEGTGQADDVLGFQE